jgi:hypothetical protein
VVSLIEELEAREAAARVRVEELEAQIAELTTRCEDEREAWSRLRVTRETVAGILAEMPGPAEALEAVTAREPVKPVVRVVGAVMVPHWREGLSVGVLPDVYRDIVEARFGCVGADAGEADRAQDRAARGDGEDRGDAREAEAAGGAGLAGRGPARAVRCGPQGPAGARTRSR